MTLEQLDDFLDNLCEKTCYKMKDECSKCPFGFWDYEGCCHSCSLLLFQDNLEKYQLKETKP